jgi:hypothetical protein
MIISLGTDCIVSMFCDKYNLRKMSLPFDWCVSYNGVSKCFEDDFKHFIDTIDSDRINKYDVYFHHDYKDKNTFEQDNAKYIRRCNRLQDILKTTDEEIIFVRSGHSCHHHDEQFGRYKTITSDIEDIERLDTIIATKYPNLKYRMIIFLSCANCFQPNIKYESKKNNIEIYNIAAKTFDLQRTHGVFTNIFRDAINKESMKLLVEQQ